MTEIQRGFRGPLSSYADVTQPITAQMSVSGPGKYKCQCWSIDESGLSSEHALTFSLADFPPTTSRILFTVCVDGGMMGEISSLTFSLGQALTLSMTGQDFGSERAIILSELYRKNGEWRISATASGFNGGLDELLMKSGARPKVSLEKKLEHGAPKLVSLAKPLTVELRKRNLQEITARVALVLDSSRSMFQRYANGTVQEIVNKTLPLAVQFDDDGELDCWFYGTTCRRMPGVNMSNYERAVPEDWRGLMQEIGGQTNAAEVMQEIIAEYTGSKIPAYVLFITDGGFTSEPRVRKLLTEASSLPVFWQFVGIGGKLGGRGYGILEKLKGIIGNADFFTLDDFMTVNSGELYGRLLDEFPHWLKTTA
ncbi:MAG: VWA domain-containing protein [Synergistaceae bacterium]|nr:VWA domain-containing protein [Synergistaceae bacterium]